MLDKLLLNNLIITNKNRILQARCQTINKLVQKIRKLKALVELTPDNVKVAQKLEKIPKIMVCVKKLRTADIIRQILALRKKPAAILTNGRAPPEDKAVALLANNKILVKMVSNFTTLLYLNESNPGWKDEIMAPSKRKKKLLQSDQRKKTRKVGKRKKTMKTNMAKKLPWNEEILENASSDILIEEEQVAPAKGWKVEPIYEPIYEPTTMFSKPTQIMGKTKKNPPKKKIKSLDANQSIGEPASPQKQNEKPVTTIDPFFVTGTGDNYVSTAVIDRVQPEAPDDGLIRRERRDNAMRHYKRNISNRRQSVQKGRKQIKQRFAPSSNVKHRVIKDNLHPSWAAKQKRKPIITQFKGQKITFDDNGENKKSDQKPLSKPSNAAKNVGKAEIQDNLHPSWAAKQKLKPSIAEFKGKKTTFND